VQVMRLRNGHRHKVAVSPWPGIRATIEALPVLRRGVDRDLMLRSGVLDIAQHLMLVTGDHVQNFNVAAPLIVEGLTSPEAKGAEGFHIREATLSMWRSLMMTGPPIDMVRPLYEYAIALLGPDTIISAKEMPTAINICTDYAVLGGVEHVRTHGEVFVARLADIMNGAEDPDIYRRLSIVRALNVLLPTVPAEAPKLLWPIYLAAFFKPDRTASAYWEQLSYRHDLCQHWTRLAYLQPEHLYAVLQQLGHSVPAGLASNPKYSFQGIVDEMITVISRCMQCGVRLMAVLVLSTLLLKAPTETALQPLAGALLSASVDLLHKALEPNQLSRTLWREASFYARDEMERKLQLCGVEAAAEGIPLQVVMKLKEFANIVGHPAFHGLVGEQKPQIAVKLSELSDKLNQMHSPTLTGQSGLPQGLPVSPLPAPAISPATSTFTL